MSYPYTRYLAAKRTVDDRALNRPVLAELRRLLPPGPPPGAGDRRRPRDDGGPPARVAGAHRRGVHPAGRRPPAAAGLPHVARATGRRPRAAGPGRCRTACAGRAAGAAGRGRARRLPGGRRPGNRPTCWSPTPSWTSSTCPPSCPGSCWPARARRRLLVHHQLRRRERLPARPPARRRRPGRLPPQHGRPASATAGPPGRAGRAATCSATCAPPARPRWRRVPPTGSCWPARTAPTPATRRTSSSPSSRRSRTRWTGRAAPAGLADWLAARRRQLATGELVYLAHQLDVAGRSPAVTTGGRRSPGRLDPHGAIRDDRTSVITAEAADRCGGAVRTFRAETVLGALATPTAPRRPLPDHRPRRAPGGQSGWPSAGRRPRCWPAAGSGSGQPILPADWVTLTRALLSAGAAATRRRLRRTRPLAVPALVVLASVALVLDAVDGQVARRTGTVTPFGARFDGEVDAFLILVLSVAVVPGLRRPGCWPSAPPATCCWSRGGRSRGWPRRCRTGTGARSSPPSRASSSPSRSPGVLPRPAGMVAVARRAGAAGRVVRPQRRLAVPRRRRPAHPPGGAAGHRAGRGGGRLGGSRRSAPAGPAHPGRVRPHPAGGAGPGRDRAGAPVRGPDGSWRPSAGSCWVCSPSSSCWTPASPRSSAGRSTRCSTGAPSARRSGCCATRSGPPRPSSSLVLAGLGLALLRRGRHRGRRVRLSSVHRPAPAPLGRGVAGRRRGVGGVRRAVAAARPGRSRRLDEHRRTGRRPRTGRPGDRAGPAALRGGHPLPRPARRALRRRTRSAALRGKDVLVVFVESYGQVAVEDPDIAPGVTAVLRSGTTRLARAGLEARSAFLDSPIFGGGSWLAHATLQSGLWIDSQPRYDQLLASDRLTLSGAFGQAGWRTVGVNPANDATVAGGRVLLRLRPALRPVRPRLPGAGVQLGAPCPTSTPSPPSSGSSSPPGIAP